MRAAARSRRVGAGPRWRSHTPSDRAERPGRHLLQGRRFHASSGDADRFGLTTCALAEGATGLSRARGALFASDGAGWLADLPASWISLTASQLDHSCGKRARVRGRSAGEFSVPG